MEYLIRECLEDDLPVLVELCGKHAAFEQVTYHPAEKASLLKKAIFAERPKLFCYVIVVNSKIQGYFSFTFDYSTWDAQSFLYLDCLYLEPPIRRKGIGEVIFEKLKAIARQNNCVNIQWQTPVFNQRAIKFYNKVGGIGKDKVRFFIDTKTDM